MKLIRFRKAAKRPFSEGKIYGNTPADTMGEWDDTDDPYLPRDEYQADRMKYWDDGEEEAEWKGLSDEWEKEDKRDQEDKMWKKRKTHFIHKDKEMDDMWKKYDSEKEDAVDESKGKYELNQRGNPRKRTPDLDGDEGWTPEERKDMIRRQVSKFGTDPEIYDDFDLDGYSQADLDELEKCDRWDQALGNEFSKAACWNDRRSEQALRKKKEMDAMWKKYDDDKKKVAESSEFRFDKRGESAYRASQFQVDRYLEVWVSVAPADPQQDTGALTVSLVEGSGPDSFGSALDAKYEIRIEDEDGNAEEWTSEGNLDRAKAELKNAIRRFRMDYGIELYKDDDWLDMMNEDLMNESTKKVKLTF